ncbi:hypothetical protein Leryth_001544 [Lithospermum erythrorhizon]|nr:hypothetical protein Leryth_001544 [Lithospermum erythrorhizon]
MGKFDLKSETSKVYASALVDSHDKLLESSLDIGSYNKLYSFKHIVNGFAIHTSPSQAEKLKNATGVKLTEKDRRMKMMTTYTPQFLGVPNVWTQQGGNKKAGEGIVIGFVDTGIDPIHPSFAYDPLTKNISHFSGNCETGPLFPKTSCNGKIISARFFSAGAQTSTKLNSSVDILSPIDTVGHGRIAVYKAIYPTIGTTADVLAAIDQAMLDGVDILTLSIGPDEPPEESVTVLSMFEIFMLSARRAGVFVVQAAGNQGPGPYSVISYSPWVVGVAAAGTDRSYPGSLLLGNGKRISGVGLSGPNVGNLKYKVKLARDAVMADGEFPRIPEYTDECQHPQAFDRAVVLGSVVLCTFSAGFNNGTSSLLAIAQTATALGFMGFVLLANPAFGDYIAEPFPFSVPGMMIPRVQDSQTILQYYEQQTSRDNKGKVEQFGARASISEGRVASYMGRAPIVSRFSSRGPDFINQERNPINILKPDILAPGHQIWGAWTPISAQNPMYAGYNFALISGTSMAAPHVAGIAALIKQNHPSWTPSMIASAMSTTAIKHDNHGDPLMAEGFGIDDIYPAAPFGFGAGLVNPSQASDPGLVFSTGFEDYITFLCTLPNVDPSRITIATGGTCPMMTLANSPFDLNTPSVTITALAGSSEARRSVTSVASKPETYSCSIIQPRGVSVDVQPSWFTIAPQETQDLVIRLQVTKVLDDFSFGEIVLTGSLNHIVRVPLSVFPVSMT